MLDLITNPLINPNIVRDINQINKDRYEFRGISITLRQLEILSLLSEGYNKKEIADIFVVSINTIRKHLADLYKIFKVNTIQELIVFCYRGKIK